MDLKELKLELIRKISQSDDVGVLRTVLEVLEQLDAPPDAVNKEALSALLKEQPKPWQQGDLDDLQSSIDEIFG